MKHKRRRITARTTTPRVSSCLDEETGENILDLVIKIAGGEVKIVALDKVNTEADEDDPFVTANGLSLLYASNQNGTYDIWMSKRTSTGVPFPAGKPYLASKEDDERSPFVLPAQTLQLYYAVNHVPDPKLKDLRNFDIVRRTGEMAPLPMLQISEKEDEMHPWLTAAGPDGQAIEVPPCGHIAGIYARIDKVIGARARQAGVPDAVMREQYINKISLRRMTTAEDVAAMCLFLCAPAARNVSGQAISVDGNVEYL